MRDRERKFKEREKREKSDRLCNKIGKDERKNTLKQMCQL